MIKKFLDLCLESRGNRLFNLSGNPVIPLPSLCFRTLQFIIQLGSVQHTATCRRPLVRRENVFVQFSTDHTLTWNTLRELDYEVFSVKPTAVELPLPKEAKSSSTSFRWWQPLSIRGDQFRFILLLSQFAFQMILGNLLCIVYFCF